jgi:hypothetical protein
MPILETSSRLNQNPPHRLLQHLHFKQPPLTKDAITSPNAERVHEKGNANQFSKILENSPRTRQDLSSSPLESRRVNRHRNRKESIHNHKP